MSSSRIGTKPKDSGKGEHTCATGRSMEPSRLFQSSDPCWLDSCPLCTVTGIPSRTKVLHAVTIKDIVGRSDVMFYWKIGAQSMLIAQCSQKAERNDLIKVQLSFFADWSRMQPQIVLLKDGTESSQGKQQVCKFIIISFSPINIKP